MIKLTTKKLLLPIITSILIVGSLAAANYASALPPAVVIALESGETGTFHNVLGQPGTAGVLDTDYALGTYLAGGDPAPASLGHGFPASYDFQSGHFVAPHPPFTPTGALSATDHNWLQGTTTPIIVDLGAGNESDQAIVFNSIDHLGFDEDYPNDAEDLWNAVIEGIEFTVYATNDLNDANAAAGTDHVFRTGTCDAESAGVVPGAGAGSTFEQGTLSYVFEDGWFDFGNAAEGDDFASVWKFSQPYRYIAVFSDCTDAFIGDGFASFDNELDAIGRFLLPIECSAIVDNGGVPHICKTVTITESGGVDGVIEVGESIKYEITIDIINNSGNTWLDVSMHDRFAGNLAVGDGSPASWPTVQLDVIDSVFNLDCDPSSLTQKGKTAKEFLDCDFFDGDQDMDSGQTASVTVIAWTDFNHGQGKKTPTVGTRSYTSCGADQDVNSGATLEFEFPVTVPHEFQTPSVLVDVFEFEDLSGDCDMDGISDFDEINDVTNTCLDPFNDDSDGDGIIDGDELSGIQNTDFGNAATDPCDDDSDGDGLLDGEETSGSENNNFGNAPTDPNDANTDGDGCSDFVETSGATDPNSFDAVCP